MTNIFDGRDDPASPVTLSPRAAADGGGAGLDASFFLSLGASVGTLTDEIRADRHRREAMLPPSDESLFASGVCPSSGTLTLALGSVPQGRVWQVRRVVAGGATVTTTAAGKAWVFAQGAPPNDLNLTNWKDGFTTLPLGNTYGTHQFYMLASAHLWVVFTGATSTQQYTAAADVEDWEATNFRSTFTE